MKTLLSILLVVFFSCTNSGTQSSTASTGVRNVRGRIAESIKIVRVSTGYETVITFSDGSSVRIYSYKYRPTIR